MIDEGGGPSPNIRGLVQDLSERLDGLAAAERERTALAGARPADAKTFMLISRHPRGLTDLARALGVSRQAAHQSLQRLKALGLVRFDLQDGSRRDRAATVTPAGLEAQRVGLGIARAVEARLVAHVGREDVETLRRILVALNAGLASEEAGAAPGAGVAAPAAPD